MVIGLERAVPKADDGTAAVTVIAAMAVAGPRERGERGQGENHSRSTPGEESDLGSHREHLLPLEPEVLERFGRLAVQTRRTALIAATRREVALGNPGGRAMRCG